MGVKHVLSAPSFHHGSARTPHPLAPSLPRIRWRLLACLGLAWLVSACQTVPHEDDDPPRASPPTVDASATQALFPGWVPLPMPGKRWAQFQPVEQDGRAGVQVVAQSSLSILRKKLEAPLPGPWDLGFSWWVERTLPDADLGDAAASDAPARVALGFDGDRSRFSARDHLVSELTALVTGDELPYATLVYVWSNRVPVGTVVPNPRTSRIRYLVVNQGSQQLGQWVNHQRDVQADFVQAFGEPPGRLLSLGLMTDTDNTGSSTRTVYGPVALKPR